MLERIVEDLANRVLSMDPAAAQRLALLHGSTVVVAFDAAPLPSLLFRFDNEQISVDRVTVTEQNNHYDLRLNATPVAYLRAGLADEASDLTAYGIQVSGDSDVATRFTALVKQLDIDWEDELALRIGDVPARALSVFASRGKAWSRQARTTITDNIGEFVTEESGEVPIRSDVENFLDEVDVMRNQVDSVAARIVALERKRMNTDMNT